MEQRLIDANEYAEKVCTYQETGCGSCANQIHCPNNAPTVLTIPDNPTNGDMIKALFPDGKICRTNNFEIGLRFKGDNWIIWFKDRWWNSPYKKEAENDQ